MDAHMTHRGCARQGAEVHHAEAEGFWQDAWGRQAMTVDHSHSPMRWPPWLQQQAGVCRQSHKFGACIAQRGMSK